MIPFQIPELPTSPIPSVAPHVDGGAEFAAVFAEVTEKVGPVAEPETVVEAQVEEAPVVESEVPEMASETPSEDVVIEAPEAPDLPKAEVTQAEPEQTTEPEFEQPNLFTDVPAQSRSDEPAKDVAEPTKAPITSDDEDAEVDAFMPEKPSLPDAVALPQQPMLETPIVVQPSVDIVEAHSHVPPPVKTPAPMASQQHDRQTTNVPPVQADIGSELAEQRIEGPEPTTPETPEDASAETPPAPRERNVPMVPPTPTSQPNRAPEPPTQRIEVPVTPDIAPLRTAIPDEPGVVIAAEAPDMIEVDIPQGKDAPVKLRIETADDSAVVTVTTERQMIEPVQRALPVLSDEMVRSGFASLSVNVEARGDRQKRQQRPSDHPHDDAPQERPRITTGIDIRI